MYKAKARLSFSEPRPSRSSFVLLRADAQHCAHATVRMWLAQIGLRTTPGTRRKLQPPACCNKLAFSSNINSGPWTHTSPEARRFRILSSDINSEPCIHTYIHTYTRHARPDSSTALLALRNHIDVLIHFCERKHGITRLKCSRGRAWLFHVSDSSTALSDQRNPKHALNSEPEARIKLVTRAER